MDTLASPRVSRRRAGSQLASAASGDDVAWSHRATWSPVRHIVVDGYNVIRADARLQSFERQSLKHARQVLAQMLASSPRLANDRIIRWVM